MESAHPCRFSIEFFPPRTSVGESKLDTAHKRLAKLQPDFFSVTYGAGGSTKKGTQNLVLKYTEAGSSVAPHLSFGSGEEDEVRQLLQTYKDGGIDRLVCLRGDVPSGSGGSTHHRYASELVRFVREEFADHFHIEVACYPEIHPDAPSYTADIAYFREKVEAGANSAITQYFYNADAYFRFVDACANAGINVPIVPGIMPITNYASLARFSAKCGAEIPQWLRYRLDEYGEDDADNLRAFGLDFVTELCDKLLAGGAPGLHFYSMNVSRNVTEIWNNLALNERR